MNPQPSRKKTNRANAQHSTGPKTEAGKQRSSLNALRHGLTAQRIVMPEEDQDAYQNHVESFTSEYHPQGPTETHLVQSLADTSWRLNRAAALEVNALAGAADFESQARALATLSLHTQRLSRQFERTAAQLRELQQTRQFEEQRELSDLLDIIEMYESKGEPYNPSSDGFVFSKPQIAATRASRHRTNLATEAFSYLQAA
jgi:hypothetical protein